MKVAFFSTHFPLGRESTLSLFVIQENASVFLHLFMLKNKSLSLGSGKCLEKNARFRK